MYLCGDKLCGWPLYGNPSRVKRITAIDTKITTIGSPVITFGLFVTMISWLMKLQRMRLSINHLHTSNPPTHLNKNVKIADISNAIMNSELKALPVRPMIGRNMLMAPRPK